MWQQTTNSIRKRNGKCLVIIEHAIKDLNQLCGTYRPLLHVYGNYKIGLNDEGFLSVRYLGYRKL